MRKLPIIQLTRINQPTGIWLLFLPCLFGISLAFRLKSAEFSEIFKVTFLFLIGSVIMRSAGCIINDLFDKDFDKKVTRTKNRPLANNSIKQSQALIILSILLTFGLIILLQFNAKTILFGLGLLILITLYPLMKRITYYPQIFLGVIFNSGILMSSFAILNELRLEFVMLYFASIIWTVIYDTIYGYQDIEDDLRIGVKSTAIRFAENPKKYLILLNLAMFLIFVYFGHYNNFRSEFFLIIGLASLMLTRKIQICNFANPNQCMKIFKFNIWIGTLILVAIIYG